MSSYCLVQFVLLVLATKLASYVHMYNHNTIATEEDYGTVCTMLDGVVY